MPATDLAPGEYAVRVLVMLVGTSPAVVTETLYALCSPQASLPFAPTRLVMLTTTEGRDELKRDLLDDAVNSLDGARVISRLQRLAEVLGLPPTLLQACEVVVPRLDDGSEITDVHAAEELAAMGDAIYDVVGAATQHEDSAVVLSLSGGRKSMSHMAGQCMTVLARPQDRLVHVIVEPGWVELVPDFHYPGDEPGELVCPDPDLGPVTCERAEVQIQLTQELIVRMRLHLADTAKARKIVDGVSGLTLTGWAAAMLPQEQRVALRINAATGQAWVGGRELGKPEGGNGPFINAYLTLLAERGAIRHPPTTDEAFALLELWERQAGAPFDVWERVDAVLKLFRPRLEDASNLFTSSVPQPAGPDASNVKKWWKPKSELVPRAGYNREEWGRAFVLLDGPHDRQWRRRGVGPDIRRLEVALAGLLPRGIDVARASLKSAPDMRTLPELFQIKWVRP